MIVRNTESVSRELDTHVSVGATVRPIGEETLALVACHARRALVASYSHSKPESEVNEIHFDGEGLICRGGGLCVMDGVQVTVMMRRPKAILIYSI